MASIQCVGMDGITRTYEYNVERDGLANIWIFRLTTVSPLPTGDFFELQVQELDANTVRVTVMSNHGIAAYRAKGIPDALLPEVKSILAKDVESSPSHGGPGTNVFRTADATKVWDRLCRQGMATYYKSRDVYRLV